MNLLSPLSFATKAEAERFIKHRNCAICLGHLSVVGGENKELHIKCWTCDALVYSHNAVSKYQAESVSMDRRIGERELSPRKKLTPEQVEETIKRLGF